MKENNKKNPWLFFWVFVVGCLFGFIIETVFYILKYHHFVNKQGLIFGPFKPIYGIGAVLITALYFLLKKKSIFKVFIYGTLIGTIFEYLASLFIEIVFDSYIWDYSDFSLNLNGRIYLPYCFMWGVISVIWIKFIFPYIEKFINKLSDKKLYKIISTIFFIFMLFNVILTSIVMARDYSSTKTNKVYQIIDKFYTKKDIDKKFPKLRKIK